MAVLFRPRGDITKAPAPRTWVDTAFYQFLGESLGITIAHDPQSSVDYEDWMEPMCLLEQAIHNGLEIKILRPVDLPEAIADPLHHIPGKPCRDFLIGRQLRFDPVHAARLDLGWPSVRDEDAVHYAELESFKRNAGRKLAFADMPGDPSSARNRKTVFGGDVVSGELGDVLTQLGATDVVVKQVHPAKALPIIHLHIDKDMSPQQAGSSFLDETEYHFCMYEGDKAALLVQEKITMTHETRFFVIGGKVITGAACIESHTPLDCPHWDTVLPPVWEIIRGSGEMDTRELMPRKRTALQMWQYAWNVCAQIQQEAPELDAYTLDIALNTQGEPVVIEINPAANSGLYASNAINLFDAIYNYAQSAPHRGVESMPSDTLDMAQAHVITMEDDTPFDD